MSVIRNAKAALEVISTLVVTVAGVFLIWSLIKTPSIPARRPKVEPVSGLQVDAGAVRNRKGQARVAVLEFTDFQCPFCATYAKRNFPEIESGFIEKGKVQYGLLHFPLEHVHPLAFKAAEGAECAARQGKFWPMHDRLFAAAPALTSADLLTYAHELELDQPQFERCLRGETSESIRADQALAKKLNIEGTPSFFLGIVREDGSIDIRRRINGFLTASELTTQLVDLTPN